MTKILGRSTLQRIWGWSEFVVVFGCGWKPAIELLFRNYVEREDSNAKTPGREGRKASLNYLCVFASLRLCVKNGLVAAGGRAMKSLLEIPLKSGEP